MCGLIELHSNLLSLETHFSSLSDYDGIKSVLSQNPLVILFLSLELH